MEMHLRLVQLVLLLESESHKLSSTIPTNVCNVPRRLLRIAPKHIFLRHIGGRVEEV